MRKEKKTRVVKKVTGVLCAGLMIMGVSSLVPSNAQTKGGDYAQASSREEVVYVQIEDEKIPLAYTALDEEGSESENSAKVDGFEEDNSIAGRIVE